MTAKENLSKNQILPILLKRNYTIIKSKTSMIFYLNTDLALPYQKMQLYWPTQLYLGRKASLLCHGIYCWGYWFFSNTSEIKIMSLSTKVTNIVRILSLPMQRNIPAKCVLSLAKINAIRFNKHGFFISCSSVKKIIFRIWNSCYPTII